MAVKMVVRVCLVVLAAVALASAACGSGKSAPSASASPASTAPAASTAASLPTTAVSLPTAAATPSTPRPSLTSEQKQNLVDIASKDANITHVMAGLSAPTSSVAAWANSQGTLIGGVVIMNLAQPATIDGEWRGISWDSSKVSYLITVYTAKFSNVTAVNAWIDLGKAAVVGWTADSGAHVEATPVIIATPAPQ
jgi:hypothetical protein